MSTRTELETAILADPDARAAYAVYADWLLEHSDPLGELIRVQHAGEPHDDLIVPSLFVIQGRDHWLLRDVLDWIERGGPLVVQPTRRGFGSKLLSQVLGSPLGKTTQLIYDERGLECRLFISLD